MKRTNDDGTLFGLDTPDRNALAGERPTAQVVDIKNIYREHVRRQRERENAAHKKLRQHGPVCVCLELGHGPVLMSPEGYRQHLSDRRALGIPDDQCVRCGLRVVEPPDG